MSISLDLDNFAINGCADIGSILDPAKAAELRTWLNIQRPVNPEIFYQNEKEFEEKGRWYNYAPGRTDHNILMTENPDLSFIEKNTAFKNAMTRLCGDNWKIMKKSVIRSVPKYALPEWIYERVKNVGRPNLNPFIYDKYQDVQYFLTTDFHQDKTRPESSFVTVYIYLDNVDPDYSALHILKGSHKLGMTTYPHNLRRSFHDKETWYYSDALGNHETCSQTIVTGGPGSIFCFHSLTLHGTVLNNAKDPRISLRYLIQKDDDKEDIGCLLDLGNRKVYGPTQVKAYRSDVAPDGSYLETGSSLLG